MVINSPVKIVLLQPPLRNIIGAATPDYIDENRGFTPPMGLLYLKAAIDNSIHESVFIDANLECLTHEEAAIKALEYQPDIIGIQAMTFTMPDAYLTALEIKRISPKTATLIGGPHPTIFPKETANLNGVDFAFAGEGEFGLGSFLDVYFDSNKYDNVPGLAYKKNGLVNYSTKNELIEELDKLSFPARRASNYKRYHSVLSLRTPSTVMITSRGCPFNCIFCNRMGRKYRMHSAEYVLSEFDDIASMGIREVFIHDDTFSLNRERVELICLGLIERQSDIIWEARTRVDCVDKELLKLMRKAGCVRLSFGVESGSSKVLKSMRKGTNPEQVIKVFKWCKELGIITLADFMFGNLDETENDIKMSIELMKSIDPDYVQFSILSLYPGTPIYEMALEQGLIDRDVWFDFACNPLHAFSTPIWTKHFSEEQLELMTQKAFRSFYLRPRFVWKQLQRVRSFSQLKTLTRSGMAILFRR